MRSLAEVYISLSMIVRKPLDELYWIAKERMKNNAYPDRAARMKDYEQLTSLSELEPSIEALAHVLDLQVKERQRD
jgi:hypothetical protein